MSDFETPQHWPRGGSKAPRIAACPGCLKMEEAFPQEGGSGAAAIDGTHSHTLLEKCLQWSYLPHNFIGDELEDHEGKFIVDAERAARVRVAYDFVNYQLNVRYNNGADPQMELEKFVDAGTPYGIPGWGGSADIIVFDRNPANPNLMVVDYKDGFRPVMPTSFQLASYALGSIHTLHLNPETITQVVVQPKVSKEAKKVTYERKEFQEYVAPLIEAMRESMDPNAVRIAGDHCRYCPGAAPGRCPEYGAYMSVSISDAFSTVPAATGEHATPNVLPFQLPEISEATTNEQLSALLDAEPLVISLFKNIREEAVKRAQIGNKVPGYKIIRRRSQRRYKDKGAVLELLESFRIPKKHYLDESLKSPKQLLADERIEKLKKDKLDQLNDLIIKPEGAMALVPESDPGEEVIFDAKQLFPENIEKPEEAEKKPLSAPPSFSL